MKQIQITAVRQSCYEDLMAQYEQPMENACCVQVGQRWISENGMQPPEFCDSAWQTIEPFVRALAAGGGSFYGEWMKNPHSAMLSCNDGFRPVSFYLETVE